jgi:hypothetical protein
MSPVNTWDEPSWDEELTRNRYRPVPELPEDVLFHMLKRNPQLEKFINDFNLEIEY